MLTQETWRLLDDLRAELRPADRAELLAELRAELRAALRAERRDDWRDVGRPHLRADPLTDLRADLLIDMLVDWPAEARAGRPAEARAGRPAEARAAQSPSEAEGLRLRAARLASKWPRVWSRLGSFLPPRSRKVLEPDLAEHAADFFEALSMAGSRREQDRLIVRFTIAAIAKVLAWAGVACRRRLLDEFTSLMGLAGRRARGTSSVWARCRLHLDRLDRYHGAAALVMTCGSVGMIASAFLAIVPLWVGFLAGALPPLLLTTLVHPEHA